MKQSLLGSGILLLIGAGFAAGQEPPYAPAGSSPDGATGVVGPRGAPNGRGSTAGAAPVTVYGDSFGPGQPAPAFSTPAAAGPPAGPHPTGDFWSAPCLAHAEDCWITPEYQLWWVRRGPPPGPLAASRRLDEADSQPLLGDSRLDYRALSGGRLTAGAWCDEFATVGLEARGFVLEQGAVHGGVASGPGGAPALGVPFFNTDTGREDLLQVSTPGQTVGRVDFSSTSRLWGAEGNALFNLFRDCHVSLDVLAGFRYLDLQEALTINTASSPLLFFQVPFGGTFFDPPDTILTADRFATRNHFYGGQLGARAGWRLGGLSLDVAGKVALGDTHEVVTVSGSSTLNAGPVPARTVPGGVFALPSNIGRTTGDDFTVVPELEARVGYQFGRHLGVFAGYNITYWSRVVRPGDQVNRGLSVAQISTANAFGRPSDNSQPSPVFNTTDFWAQGLLVGLEIRY
jgi:hypothetical protein